MSIFQLLFTNYIIYRKGRKRNENENEKELLNQIKFVGVEE